jgi:Alpha/beta hydrolase of unknown function (DUF900)
VGQSWVSTMRPTEYRHGMWRLLRLAGIALLSSALGCRSPEPQYSANTPAAVSLPDPSGSTLSPLPGQNDVILGPDSGDGGLLTPAAQSLVETWVVHTRACEQKIGTDPWASITIARFDGPGVPLHGAPPEALIERMAGRTSVFLIHGYGYGYSQAVDEAVKVRTQLDDAGGLPPETLLIVFDWPSERQLRDLYADLNEKAKRTRIASYHLARFLQEAPGGCRICFLGQSDGGRLALTTMHLLSGATLPAIFGEPAAQLNGGRPDLRLRCVIVDAAAGHNWLNPGERLDQALPSCESLYNIYNTGDVALMLFIFGRFTGFRPAIGRVGLTSHDRKALGPLSARVEQIDLHARVGFSHTSVPQALGFPDIAEHVARYTSWSELGSTSK